MYSRLQKHAKKYRRSRGGGEKHFLARQLLLPDDDGECITSTQHHTAIRLKFLSLPMTHNKQRRFGMHGGCSGRHKRYREQRGHQNNDKLQVVCFAGIAECTRQIPDQTHPKTSGGNETKTSRTREGWDAFKTRLQPTLGNRRVPSRYTEEVLRKLRSSSDGATSRPDTV